MNSATSSGCERKIAWLPGSSMVVDLARLLMNRSKIRVEHAILLGNHRVARFVLPGRNGYFGIEYLAGDRHLRYRHV